MYRDIAIGLLAGRLGQRTGLEQQVATEMQLVQDLLEQDPFLPWFLESCTAQNIDVGLATLTLPSGFLRIAPAGIWVYDGISWAEIKGEEYILLRANNDLLVPGKPAFYSLVGPYLLTYPPADQAYIVHPWFCSKDVALSSNIENQWLKYAPDLLISYTGERMAKFLRDASIEERFKAERQEAYGKLILADEARRQSAQTEMTLGG